MATITGYIPDAGLASAAALLGNVGSEPAYGWIAVGSNSDASTAGATKLGAELTDSGFARQAAVVTISGATISFATTFTATGAATVREIGLFNASSNGDMLTRGILGADKTFASTDTYAVTIEIDNARTA